MRCWLGKKEGYLRTKMCSLVQGRHNVFGAVSWKFGDVVSYCGDLLEQPVTDVGTISVGSSCFVFSELQSNSKGTVFLFTMSTVLSNGFLRQVP